MKHDEHIENAKSFSEIFDQVEHFLGIKLKTQKSLDTLLQAVIHYYEALIGCMPGNVYWLNKTGYTVGCNQNVLVMFGLQTLSQFRGLTFEQLGELGNWSPDATKSFKKDTFEVIKTGVAKLNIEEPSIPDQYGRQIHFLTHRVPLFDQHHHVVGVVGISVDVTERKRLLDELRKAKEHAEAANHTKSEFIANMSHDLRTPLAGIIGISNILENKLKTPEEKHEAHMLYESGNSLMSLCNGILEMASLENVNDSEVKPISFDLGQELLEVCRLEMPALKMKGLDIVIHLNPTLPRHIITDKIKLQRILLNFLGNAIKFTEKGNVTLEVNKHKETKSELVLKFSIADTGIGIPKSLHKKIFDRFYRISPSYKGMHPGFGVGLALVKHYVELLGGSVHLESEPDCGSIFSFTLPVRVDAEKEEAIGFLDCVNFYQELAALKTPVLEKMGSKGLVAPVIQAEAPHILLVEDNLTVLHVLESSVQEAGCRVTAVTSGEEGFALTSRVEFDLIICDIGLPGISGIEMTKKIRARENACNQKWVPIVALTGHAAENAEQDCLRSGMNKVLTKPITRETLMALLTVFTKPAQKTPSPDVKVLANKGLPAEKANLFILKKFPVLDIELAKEQFGDHLSLLVNSLTMLIETLPQDKAAIIQAHEAGDWEAVEKLAHRMKGGAVYCGASRMMYACQYLERYRQAEGDGELLPGLYEQLLLTLEETEKIIGFWLEANRPIH